MSKFYPQSNSKIYLSLVKLLFLFGSGSGYASVESTTTIGILNRTVELTLLTSDGSNDFSAGELKTVPENLSGIGLCQRVSANTSFGLKFGAGGCVQLGGQKVFYNAVSTQLTLIYYPFTKKASEINDIGLRTDISEGYQVYFLGITGFSKITSSESSLTNVSIATDSLDFGGGAGFSYGITRKVQLTGEFQYLASSIMSTVAQGSTSSMFMGLGIELTL